LRTRLQAGKLSQEQESKTYSSEEPKKKRTSLELLREIVKTEGLSSFYRGLNMALIGTVASYGSYFFCYRMWKNILSSALKVKSLTALHISLITFLSGSSSTVFANPFWFVNTRMTIDKSSQHIFTVVKQIYKQEGIQAFFKGVLPNLVLVLNPIINFVVYEALIKWFKSDKQSPSTLKIFIASSLGKTLATFATYPILTIRVLMQANKENKPVWQQLRQIMRELETRDYFKGISAKLLQTILNNAFLLIVYEKLRRLLAWVVRRYITRRHIK
jgi:solute carrier family 25 (peroxisomal adenine nucleotide transporter), member 17